MFSNSFVSRRISPHSHSQHLSSGKNVSELISSFEVKQRDMFGGRIYDSGDSFDDKMAMPYGDTRGSYTRFTSRPIHLMQHGSTVSSITSLDDSDIYSDHTYDHDLHKRHHAQTMNDIDTQQLTATMGLVGRLLQLFAYIPFFGMSVTGMGISFLVAVFFCPRSIGELLLFPAFRLLFGTLYPAYASYKAVRTKNVKEYVKWMMYWIVYALFTCTETFTDIFLSWFPFYYEVKVIIVIWLLSPATKGSSTLYRKFVHPMLTRREQEIDEYINQAKEKGYTAVLQLGSKGVNYATNVIMQTALKGGGNLVQTIRRSYSLSDLSEPGVQRTQDEIDNVSKAQRLQRPRSQTARSSSGGRQMNMYFSEVEVAPKTGTPNYNYIRSSEDISSGYSSAEPVSGGLSRTSSMTNASRSRIKAKRAEGEIYLESDEYETIEAVPYGYPQLMNHEQPRPTYDSDSDFIPNAIEEYKDEAFLDNERYFQRSSQYTTVETIPSNIPDEMKDKYAMFCKWLDSHEVSESKEQMLKISEEEEEKKKPESILIEEPKHIKEDTIKSSDIQSKVIHELITESKVKSDNIEQDQHKVIHEPPTVNVEPTPEKVPSFREDEEFLDTISQASADDDVFADANATDENKPVIAETKSENPTILVEDIMINAGESNESPTQSSNVEVDTSTNENTATIQSITLHTIENLVRNVNVQLQNETSLLKRPVSHGKGKAPSPPELYPLKTSSSWTNVNTTITTPSSSPSEHLSESVSASISSLTSSKSDITPSSKNTDYLITRKSVTPEPSISSISDVRDTTPEPPKKSKRSLFRNYLPSIFRSESPKARDETKERLSNEDVPKETEI